MAKKLKTGWHWRNKKAQKTTRKVVKKPQKKAPKSQFFKYLIQRKNRPTLQERIVKTFIWIALRIAILNPKHWASKRKNRETVHDAYERITSNDFVFIPPAFAFYLIMAIIPVIFFVFIIIVLIGLNGMLEPYMKTIFAMFSIQNADSQAIITELSKGGWPAILFTSLLILTSLWIASGGMAKFVYTESHIYKHEKFGGFWMNRFKGMSMVLFLVIYLTLIILAIAGVNESLVAIGLAKSTIGFKVIIWIFYILFAFISIYLLFGILYKFSPRFKLKWREIHAGALTATLPTALFILLFTQLNKITLNYKQFGTFSTFMSLATSLLIISYFVYVGLLVNAVYYKKVIGERTVAKKTFSKK